MSSSKARDNSALALWMASRYLGSMATSPGNGGEGRDWFCLKRRCHDSGRKKSTYQRSLITPRLSPSRVHWARRPPLRHAHSLAMTGYLHNDLDHCGGADETSVAHTATVSRDGGWSPAVGSGLATPAALEQPQRGETLPKSSSAAGSTFVGGHR